MTPETAVRARLLADPVLGPLLGASQVGTVWQGRVYAKRLPQDPKYPAITYRRESGNDDVTQEGRIGPEEPRLQVDCHSTSYDEGATGVVQLAEAVREALHGQDWITDEGDRVSARLALPPMDLDVEPAASPKPAVLVHRRIADYFVFFGKAD